MSTSFIGQTLLNQFRVDAYLASGGMGTVYRVWDLKRNVPLAMKVLHEDLAEDPSIFKRFKREARALEKLAHPNIVPFYGLHQTKAFAFLLERYIDGPTLKQVLRRRKGKPLPVEGALSSLRAVSSALGYAHAHGVVHCDVKPGNVMIEQGGSVYLTDFGVARHAESTTTTLGFAGTAAYMAPEQCRGEEVTAQTDVYALGVMLYEMLTGRRPFRGDEGESEGHGTSRAERVRWAHVHLEPRDPREVNPELSEGMAQVILKAMAKAPDERFASTQEMYVEACEGTGVEPLAVPDRLIEPSEILPAASLPRRNLQSNELGSTAGTSALQRPLLGLLPRYWAFAIGFVVLAILALGAILGGSDDNGGEALTFPGIRISEDASSDLRTDQELNNGSPSTVSGQDRDTVGSPDREVEAARSSVSVSGRLGWQQSGMQAKQGDRVQITYEDGLWAGRVGFGPELPDIWADAAGIEFRIYYDEIGIEARFVSLIARVGDGPAIEVGKSRTFAANSTGEIYLRMHDIDMADNDGSLTVRVQILP